MNQQPDSLLFKLPPELRIIIYELVFCVNGVSVPEGRIKVVEAARKAPDGTILLVCKAISHEAKKPFEAFTKAYWHTTMFDIRRPKTSSVNERKEYYTIEMQASRAPMHNVCAGCSPGRMVHLTRRGSTCGGGWHLAFKSDDYDRKGHFRRVLEFLPAQYARDPQADSLEFVQLRALAPWIE